MGAQTGFVKALFSIAAGLREHSLRELPLYILVNSFTGACSQGLLCVTVDNPA